MKTFVILATLLFSSFFISIPSSFAAGVSKQQAASIAKSKYPGRVIDIKEIKQNSTEAYRVKVLDEAGGMHIVIINKESGAVLSAH